MVEIDNGRKEVSGTKPERSRGSVSFLCCGKHRSQQHASEERAHTFLPAPVATSMLAVTVCLARWLRASTPRAGSSSAAFTAASTAFTRSMAVIGSGTDMVLAADRPLAPGGIQGPASCLAQANAQKSHLSLPQTSLHRPAVGCMAPANGRLFAGQAPSGGAIEANGVCKTADPQHELQVWMARILLQGTF